jgi:sulfite exporter TauE/SafE
MNKIIAYIIALVGLAVIILSLNSAKLNLPSSIKPAYIMIAGIILVIFGVVLVMNKGKSKQASEEVPIYSGKKIVGYRKQK